MSDEALRMARRLGNREMNAELGARLWLLAAASARELGMRSLADKVAALG